MKTVAEHNEEAKQSKFLDVPGSPIGIACPCCGEELQRFTGFSGDSYQFFIDATNRGKLPCFCRGCKAEVELEPIRQKHPEREPELGNEKGDWWLAFLVFGSLVIVGVLLSRLIVMVAG